MITIDDFQKLEIKIGKVKSVEKVPETDKLLKFIFDVGSEERQIVSGIAEFFPEPSILVGKEMPLLLNLEPRKFKGCESQGMMLAADVAGQPILLHPEKEIPAGSSVK
jgi:methionine--tRNA ligase beta chain